MLYSPAAVVVAVRVPWRAGLVTVTVTPGSALPSASLTIPMSVPVVVAANAPAAARTPTNANGAGPIDRIPMPTPFFPVFPSALTFHGHRGSAHPSARTSSDQVR